MSERDSLFADGFVASLGYAGGHYDEVRGHHAIIVHTTGAGVLRRFREEGLAHEDTTPLDTAVRIYSRIMGASSGFAAPHYVVGQDGRCVQVCRETFAAHHVGAVTEFGFRRLAAKRLYALPTVVWSAGCKWWFERWPHVRSPLDLAGGQLWAGGSCNRNTIGVEVVPPDVDRPSEEPWSPACWETLRELLPDISERRHIPWEREHIITHSDAHPVARSTKGRAWDPPSSQWSWEILDA